MLKTTDHKSIEVDVGEEGEFGYLDFLRAVDYLVCFYQNEGTDFERKRAGQYLGIYAKQMEAGE